METTDRIPNAKKWTKERVTEELVAIKYDAVSEDVDYLGIALIRQGLYIQLWAYWKKVFYTDDDILEQMMMIESIFEARLVQGAMRKKVSPGIAMFILKNKYHWSDRPSAVSLPTGEPMLIRLDADTIIVPEGPYPHTYRRLLYEEE